MVLILSNLNSVSGDYAGQTTANISATNSASLNDVISVVGDLTANLQGVLSGAVVETLDFLLPSVDG